ncbi:hypothetical protein F4782DRAFT_369554 [Xylaria castorea]|nr:hypothetical protein F4782DRAFT_369554 [Xylaria castorea]
MPMFVLDADPERRGATVKLRLSNTYSLANDMLSDNTGKLLQLWLFSAYARKIPHSNGALRVHVYYVVPHGVQHCTRHIPKSCDVYQIETTPKHDLLRNLILILAVSFRWLSRILCRSLIHSASFTAVPAKPMMRGFDLLVSARHAYHELHVGPTITLGNSDGKQRRRHADLGASKSETGEAFGHALTRFGGSTTGRCQCFVWTPSV